MLKRIIKSFLKKQGYEIFRRFYYDFGSDDTIKNILNIAKINFENLVIFDVGANIGQSVDRFRLYAEKAKIFSFEPNPEVYSILKRKKSTDNNLKTFNFGLGEKKDILDFYAQPDSGGSSFIPIDTKGEAFKLSNTDLAKENHNRSTLKKDIELNTKVSLPIETLINVANIENIEIIHLLKIDTQGFESEVLKGCGDKLKDILIIETEIIFSDAYEKAGTFYEVEEIIKKYGFVLWDIPYIGKFASDDINKINFIDATYVNEKLLKEMRSS